MGEATALAERVLTTSRSIVLRHDFRDASSKLEGGCVRRHY